MKIRISFHRSGGRVFCFKPSWCRENSQVQKNKEGKHYTHVDTHICKHNEQIDVSTRARIHNTPIHTFKCVCRNKHFRYITFTYDYDTDKNGRTFQKLSFTTGLLS